MEAKRIIDIDAPVENVWSKLSKLTDIQDWSTTVTEAHFHTEKREGLGAGRTCQVKGFGTLVEEVTDWSENETFTLSIEGMPRFVKKASGTWRLEKTGAQTTRATTSISVQAGWGFVGSLMEQFVLGPQMGKALDGIQAEFKHYVERAEADEKVA